jgi:hypothetical protein
MATLGAFAIASDLGGVDYSAMVGRKTVAVIACRSDFLFRDDHVKGRSKRTGDHGSLEQSACATASSGKD